ncbi:MAG: MFS transporter [Anaerolineales bacterium]|nr:MFS transporter [Anaerolineales bacterium]
MTYKHASAAGSWIGPFAAFWPSQALSLFGSRLVSFALIWHLAQTTDSAAVLALAALASLMPQVVLGPAAGAIVDRGNRRHILIVADSAIAAATLILSGLFAAGIAAPWQIFTFMFLRAVGDGFHAPAMLTTTTLIVPERHLARVQGLNQALEGALNIAAAPIAAVLLGFFPVVGIMLIDILTALAAVGILLRLRIPQPERAAGDARSGSFLETTRKDVIEGMRYVWRWTGLCALMAAGVCFNSLLQPALMLLPILVRRSLDGTAITLGGIQAAFGIGIVAGGAGLGIWGGFRRRVWTVVLGLAGLGASLLAAGLHPAGNALWIAGCLFGCGAMMAVIHGALFAIIQSRVVPEMQGRVMALTMSAVGMAVPIGLTLAGPLADRLGPEVWFAAAGIVCLGMAASAAASPAVQRLEDRPREGRPTAETAVG